MKNEQRISKPVMALLIFLPLLLAGGCAYHVRQPCLMLCYGVYLAVLMLNFSS